MTKLQGSGLSDGNCWRRVRCCLGKIISDVSSTVGQLRLITMVVDVCVHEFDEMMLMGQLWYCAHVLIPNGLVLLWGKHCMQLGLGKEGP